MAKLRRIDVQGFRAFGKALQGMSFDKDLCVFWGPNSQGKSSLAEAMEFLFTGQSSRRDLVAGSTEEIADSLKNVHLDAGTDVFVEIELVDDAQNKHVIRRQLTQDYSKRSPCTSVLTLNGKPTDDTCFGKLGITIGQPPIAAPVLLQHTLGYLFSTRPTDRATYFKTLLEVTDLDELRNVVASLKALIDNERKLSGLADFKVCLDTEGIKESFLALQGASSVDEVNLKKAVSSAMVNLLKLPADTTTTDIVELSGLLGEALEQVQKRTFPVAGFEMGKLGAVTEVSEKTIESITEFQAATKVVDQEVAKLLHLFEEVLKTPAVKTISKPIDCPVCGTKLSLTPQQVATIRKRVEENTAYQTSAKQFRTTLSTLDSELKAFSNSLRDALPKFLRMTIKDFSKDKIETLIGASFKEKIDVWARETISLSKAHEILTKVVNDLKDIPTQWRDNPNAITNPEELRTLFAPLKEAADNFNTALSEYSQSDSVLTTEIKACIAVKTNTKGWSELLNVGKKLPQIQKELGKLKALEKVEKEFNTALSEIEKAKDKVIQLKFSALSNEIRKWWDLLRPEEPSFFSGLNPRAMTQRSIDFKVGLSGNEDRTTPQIRDAVAVFSSSQMHCLGLATFIAKTIRDGVQFMLLDDPILSSDEDHRAHFIVSVIENLVGLGIQVIILTQDQPTFRDIEDRYAHINPDLFQIIITSPIEGTTITKTSDALRAKLAKAKPFLNSAHPEMRKTASKHLREAAERFCKDVLVNERRKKGEAVASINDYSGKTLGALIGLVEPFLTDPSHPGKLRAIARTLNPGNHDDDAPSQGDLKVSYGDLEAFRKVFFPNT